MGGRIGKRQNQQTPQLLRGRKCGKEEGFRGFGEGTDNWELNDHTVSAAAYS
jgi:hypothetical protein